MRNHARSVILLATCLFILFAANAVSAATWYVDSTSTAGPGRGDSWTNAWTNFSSIIWSGLKPGDTIEIAKGDYKLQELKLAKSGTSNAPIVIRSARDPLRKGHVFIGSLNLSTCNWVTVNGALNDSFVVPASVHDLWEITNNIGFHTHSPGPGVRSSGGIGQRLLWAEIYDSGTPGGQNEHGIHLTKPLRQSEIGYCWIRDNIQGDGINYNNNPDPSWGDLSIHHSLITNVGDDGIQMASGVDVYCCIIKGITRGSARGHSDAIQTWGHYYRIHHNIIGDFQGGGGGYASWSYSQFSTPVSGHFYLYNNLCSDEYVFGSKGFTLTFDAWFAPGKRNKNQVITNIFIANNLFHSPAMQPLAFTLHWDADRSRGTNESYTVQDCAFFNNIVVDSYTAHPNQGVVFGLLAAEPRVSVTFEDFPMDFNIVTGNSRRFGYMTQIWLSPDQMASKTPFSGNTSARPNFRDYRLGKPPYNFRLAPGDSVAKGKGKNLAEWLKRAPMLDIDLDGKKRDLKGDWDIGPYQVSP